MKKILAIAVIAVMTVALCLTANAASLHNHSSDTIYVNDNMLVDGNAGAWAEANPIDAEVQTIRVRGWAHVDDSTIAAFGYKIDDGEPVISADYIFDRADVQSYFGVAAEVANGFDITADVSNVGKGAHSFSMLVKTADGDVIEVDSFRFTQQLEGAAPEDPGEPTPTGDAAIIAIAAVGCIALAGVVVVKKAR